MIKPFVIGAVLPFAALGVLVFAFGAGGTGALAPLGVILATAFIGRPVVR